MGTLRTGGLRCMNNTVITFMTMDNGVSYQPWLSLNRVKLRIISQFWILSWNWEQSLELEKNVLQDIDPWWRCCGRWWGTGLSSTSLTQRATRPWCTRPWRTSRGRLRSVKILLYYSSSTMQSTMSLCTMYVLFSHVVDMNLSSVTVKVAKVEGLKVNVDNL